MSGNLLLLAPIACHANQAHVVAPGSQAVSPTEQARNQIDFQFLNFTHPSEAREAGARRKVRSHVTRQQHQREQQTAANNRRSRSYQQSPHLDQDQAVPQRAHAATFPAERPRTLELPRSSETSITTADASSSSSPSPVASPSSPKQLEPAEIYPKEWLPFLDQIVVSWPSTLAYLTTTLITTTPGTLPLHPSD